MEVFKCSITDEELMDMRPPVPFAIQVRFRLSKSGFKFEDDERPSLILNEDPKPLGEFVCWKNADSETTHYQQTIS